MGGPHYLKSLCLNQETGTSLVNSVEAVAAAAMAVIAEASMGVEVEIEDTIVADEAVVVRHLGKHNSKKFAKHSFLFNGFLQQ